MFNSINFLRMKYLNQIIILIGILLSLSTCESNLPFPDTDRVTIITLQKLDELPFLTSISEPNTEIKLGVKLHKFGGTEYSKVEICVVKNPLTNSYKTSVLTEITSGLTVKDSIVFTYKLSEITSKIDGASLNGGDQLGFYYNLTMPDGTQTIGWSKATGFTGVHVNAIGGQTSFVRYNVICGFEFSDLLGNWIWSDNFVEDEWEVIATEDSANPGAGLIFTFSDEGIVNGEYPPMNPLKIGINMSRFTFTFATGQIWYESLAHWGLPKYYNFHVAAGAGDINTCSPISIRFVSNRLINNGSPTGPLAGWSGYVTEIIKVD